MLLLYIYICIYTGLQWCMLITVPQNEISVCTSNPCETDAQTLDCSKHLVSNSVFSSWICVASGISTGISNMVISGTQLWM